MNFKTWNSNKIKYGIVKNLSTMNHFLIMVLCKEANLFTSHYLIWCRLPLALHPLNAFAYPTQIARMIIARSLLRSNLACTLRGMAPTPHVIMLGSWRMWLKVNLRNANFKCVLQINLEPIPLQECMPPSLSNSLLFIVMKLGQRVAQDPCIDYRVILNLWALLPCKWASKLAYLHGNIVTHSQMSN